MTAATLDETDLAIVAALVDDGRLSVNELANRVNVSRATAYSRLEAAREHVRRAFAKRGAP